MTAGLEQQLRAVEESEEALIRKNFIQRVAHVPFESALCLFAIYSGVSGLFNFGASNILFQAAIKGSEFYNILIIVAGMAAIYGIGTIRANIEAFGLCCIISSVLVRIMAILSTTGWNQVSHNLLAISILFTIASTVRLGQIMQGGFVKK